MCYAGGMTGNRSYGEQCGVARSLDVIGERWALLVVRELLLGPKRFNDLLAGLPGASPNVISQRLRELVEDGVIAQRELPPPARVRVYELTDWGRELEPVMVHLGRWGGRAPLPEGAHAGLDIASGGLRLVGSPDAAGRLIDLLLTLVAAAPQAASAAGLWGGNTQFVRDNGVCSQARISSPCSSRAGGGSG